MKVIVLSSGSKGNTTYIETEDAKILIDCGNSCRYIVEKLKNIGVNPCEITAILITHTHSDHIKGLKIFEKRFNTTVYITKKMLVDLDYLINYQIITNKKFKINDITIDVIKTSHDASDSCGFIVSKNNNSVVYITDTGYINCKYNEILYNKSLYIMESNHDVEMLNNSSYPFYLRKRILSDKGHLSNYDSAKYLANFIGKDTRFIILAHLSEENNTKELAYKTLITRLNNENIEFSKILIAEQNKETEMIEL